jgi:hypothetical protein
MEIIDLNLGDSDPIKMNLNESYNFDDGVELLINNNRQKNNTPVQLSDIQDLEKELNDLASASTPLPTDKNTKTVNGFGSWFPSFSSPKPSASLETTDSNIGQATKESVGGNTKSWDGFTKVNVVPSSMNIPTNLSERDRRRKKRMMIKKLEEWAERGHIRNAVHFNSDSTFEEVEDEYETALEDKRKRDGLKLQSWWLKTLVNSVEFANSTFDPFGIDLSGFGEQVEEDMDSYEEVFGELYEKYKGGKLSPEISILLKLGITAATINVTNKALSSATPGFRDVIKQSPDLMKMFTNATVDAMSQKSPGFSFASNMMNPPEKVNTQYGPPPTPVETKSQPPPPRTEQRPDIAEARGSMFREQGVEVGQNFQSLREPSPSSSSFGSLRPEMKGPSEDIDAFLSGLKPSMPPLTARSTINDDSMISVSSLKDLQNMKMPRQTKRRGKSEKNTISLDI